MRSSLLTPAGTVDRSAIMRRAWAYAYAGVTAATRARIATTLQAQFRTALVRVSDEAKSARALAIWAAEQDAAAEARQQIDVRTCEIEALRFERTAANGIDSTTRILATVRAIDARLIALGAR